ncbi:MAG: FG-GAP repeat protein, partial [Chloroflexi bacterium]|nr:FG-GAP repeat protein [Chloroflexota bacterium]
MRSLTTIRYFIRGAIVALVAVIAVGLLTGPAGFRPEPQSAEAALLNEFKKITASDAETGDNFSTRAVAISGDTIVAGASGEDGGVGDPLDKAGAAYVFQRDEGGAGNWGEVTKLTASDAQADDRFGFRVAVSVDTIVVGAHLEDGGAGDPVLNTGAVYVFQRDEGGANQ